MTDLRWPCRRGPPGLPIATKGQHVSALNTSQSNGVKEFLIIVLFFTYLSVTSNRLPANCWLNLSWSHNTLIKMHFTQNNNTQLKQLKHITRGLEVKWLHLVTLVALGEGFCFSFLPSSMMAFGLSPDNRLTDPQLHTAASRVAPPPVCVFSPWQTPFPESPWPDAPNFYTCHLG